MALAAITAANRTVHARHRTFGLYRLEILAALANAVLLFLVAGYVVVEAASRLGDPPHIDSLPVFVVGVIGLCVNCRGIRAAAAAVPPRASTCAAPTTRWWPTRSARSG